MNYNGAAGPGAGQPPHPSLQHPNFNPAANAANAPHPAPPIEHHDDHSVGKWKEDSKTAGAGPVKAACLSCRQKKAKCDGARPVCGQCSRKQIECIYIKSKRGGARKKRVPNPPSALVEYLKKLDTLLGVPKFDLHHAEPQEGDDPTNIVRTFGSREETLRCYYNEVHPYLPVMPPRHYLTDVLPTLLDDSPFLLAAQTIMTLVPHPLDPSPSSPLSKRLRSAASAQLGKEALACVERTMATTTSLEVVQALTILAVWEWGSTNNAETAIGRLTKAVQIAMDMGITDMDRNGTGFSLEGIDWKTDSRRRTWWLLYCYQLTASLVSGMKAPIGPDDDRIHVDFPICSDKDRTWSTWANCIRQCYRVINIVNEFVFADGASTKGLDDGPQKGWGAPVGGPTPVPSNDPEKKREMMQRVDREIMQLMKDVERNCVIEPVPGGEEDVTKNQQIATRLGLAVAHIHIHRWTAFPEVSLFSKRICGFPKAAESEDEYSSPAASSNQSDMSSPMSKSTGHVSSPLSKASATSTSPPVAQPPQIPGAFPQQNQQNQIPFQAQQQASQQQQATVPSQSNALLFNQFDPAQLEFGGPDFDAFQTQLNQSMYRQSSTGNTGSTFRDQEASQVDQLIASFNQAAPPGQHYVPGGRPQQPQQKPQRQQFDNSPNGLAAQLGDTGFYNGSGQGNGTTSQFSPSSAQYNGSNTTPAQQSQFDPNFGSPNQFLSVAPQSGQNAMSSFDPLQNAMQGINLGPTPAFDPALQQQWAYDLQQAGLTDDMWQPETFPSYLPTPWFSHPHGASELVSGIDGEVPEIKHYPELQPGSAPPPSTGSGISSMTMGNKKHRAWGVDEKGDVAPSAMVQAAESAETFPPGISLARCATAAHTIVRLEVLHRSATLAMDGPPRWIPFCSCGLVSGAYAFLLLILAVQAENSFGEYSQERIDEVENLLTNVKIIVAGLEAYGVMWEGIDNMAREVRAVVDVATQLPLDIRSQRSISPPSSIPSNSLNG